MGWGFHKPGIQNVDARLFLFLLFAMRRALCLSAEVSFLTQAGAMLS
jgi:hypothetical protein